jgi:hypothetical protein
MRWITARTGKGELRVEVANYSATEYAGFTTFSAVLSIITLISSSLGMSYDAEEKQAFLPMWNIGFHGKPASKESRGTAASIALV